MKKLIQLLITLLAYSHFLNAQTGASNVTGKIEANWNPGGIVVTKKMEVGETKGTVFLNDDWYMGSIYLTSGGSIENYPLKFNLALDNMEIKTDDEIKVLSANFIESFTWYELETSQQVSYIPCKNYKYEGHEFFGFFKVLYQDSTSLFSRAELAIKKGYYNQTHDAGTPEDEYLRKVSYFIAIGENVYNANSKKQVLHAVGDDGDQLKSFAKENKLNFGHEEDLAEIVKYYNSLSEGSR